MKAKHYNSLTDIFDLQFQTESATRDLDAQYYFSIQLHLLRLLNTRRGSLSHLPDYGLPDLATIYQSLPHSENHLINSVEETIRKYEPRLQSATVKRLTSKTPLSILHLMITGFLDKENSLRFGATFLSGGKVTLNVTDHTENNEREG